MLKPICVHCHRFFRQVKSGLYFVEGMPAGNGSAPPGLAEPDKWKPYKLWAGDKWQCEGCGAVIISGVGVSPIAEHFEDNFDVLRQALRADFQVNDC
jgi:hypothetical protein